MSALDRLNFIIATYGRLILGLFNIRLWPPFFLYFIIMLIEVWLVRSMFSPLLSGWIIPLVQWLGNERMVHYPEHLAYLPEVFERLNLGVSWLVDSLLSGTAVIMFAAYFDRDKAKFVPALKSAWQSYPKLLLVWLVVFVPILLLFWGLPGLFADFVYGAPRRQMALMVAMQGLQTVLTALFVYVVPFVLLKRQPLMRAFTENFSMFFKNFFSTIIFVAIPQFLMLPLVYVLQNTSIIVDKFNPELIVWLTIILAAVLSLSNFFIIGSIVRLFRESAED